jgi:nucleotide-binding universal stress UspA family protein
VYRSILVPVDGSKLAERAVAVAAPLAEQHGARLVLLHAHAPILAIMAGGGAPVRDPSLDLTQREEVRAYLEKLVKRLRKQTKVVVDGVFRDGPVVPTIVEEARTQGAGLIVMCTHGRGGFQRLWLGSVADGVLRHGSTPVLLIRGGRQTGKRLVGRPQFGRILVPLDGSDRAERALAVARELAGGAPVHLLLGHLVHPMTAAAAAQAARDPQREIATGYLEPLARATATPTLQVTWETAVDANVPRAILEMAKRHEADLIAIAGQGLGGLQRFVIGSSADKLIRTADAPVLVVPGVDAA